MEHFTHIVTILILITVFLPNRLKGQERNDYSSSWNTPTISHHSTHGYYQYFAMVYPYDRNPIVELSTLPPIPRLKYRSCYVMCTVDTCYANRAVFALRCPDDPILLRWASSRGEWFKEWCESADPELESTTLGKSFSSTSEILNYYIGKIEKSFKNNECEHAAAADYNQQFGFLLTDCWSIGTKYTTFYSCCWYDHYSASNTTKEWYHMINRRTGKAATINDIVEEDRLPKLADLMMQYLKDSHGFLWRDDPFHDEDPIEILNAMDACALIREGLVICFHPYSIASGSEGQITAIIPYDELQGFLKSPL